MTAPATRAQALAAMAVAAAAGWLLAPELPPAAALVRSTRDDWQLPALPRRPSLAATTVLVQSAEYWGAPEATVATAAAPPVSQRWRIAGVFGLAGNRGVVIQFDAPNKPDLHLRVGDKLPSGDRIVSISSAEVCVQVGRRQLRLAIERKDA
jgi:hypothetical protein